MVLLSHCYEQFSRLLPGIAGLDVSGNKKFQYPECGYTAHRDKKGARNIFYVASFAVMPLL